jgi:hypothetical protein
MAMSGIILELGESQEDMLACDVSDEALESAGGADQKTAANYTLGACTGISVCPGW